MWRTCRSQQRHRARNVLHTVRPDARAPSTRARRDRRKSGRIASTGTAILHGSFAAHARVLDLAIGGVRLWIDASSTPPGVGAHVHLDARLDVPGRWLHMSGTVVRIEALDGGLAFAIELAARPQDFEDLVQDELLSALERARPPRIMLVDEACGRRELVASAFRATGCHVIEVSTPREAIDRLDKSPLHVTAVVIADASASHADELRRFLGEVRPGVRLIDVARCERPRGSAILGADEIPDLALQIFDVAGLPEPIGAP